MRKDYRPWSDLRLRQRSAPPNFLGAYNVYNLENSTFLRQRATPPRGNDASSSIESSSVRFSKANAAWMRSPISLAGTSRRGLRTSYRAPLQRDRNLSRSRNSYSRGTFVKVNDSGAEDNNLTYRCEAPSKAGLGDYET